MSMKLSPSTSDLIVEKKDSSAVLVLAAAFKLLTGSVDGSDCRDAAKGLSRLFLLMMWARP